MKARKLQEIQKRLEKEKARIEVLISRHRAHALELQVVLEGTEDEMETASVLVSRDIIGGISANDRQRSKFIAAALVRIDRGTYGACLKCGEDIHEKRLLAVPWATTCIKCQAEAERCGKFTPRYVPASPEA